MTPPFVAFQTVPQLIVGWQAVAQLGTLEIIKGTRQVLLVTDPGVVRAGLLEAPTSSLAHAGIRYDIFADVVADPPETVIQAAVAAARKQSADLIIGIGGGSAMDVAKLVAVLCHHTQSLQDIYGVGNVTGARSTPLLLIPTTAGTGSEVTPISIVTTGASTKMGVVAPQLYADVALLDASLSLKLPSQVTAHTGIDAMVHAIEAYTSRLRKNPLSDMLARAALKTLWDNLPIVIADPTNRRAREAMLLGACWAGQAFANAPVAAVHALAYPLGGHCHLSHGLSNALMLPHVLCFNHPAAASLYAELGALVGVGNNAGEFIEALETLCAATGIERRLSQCGITADQLDLLANDAMLQQRLLVNNPREVTLTDARNLYAAAL